MLTGTDWTVGVLAALSTSRAEKCAAFDQLARRDREACARCGVEFPPPKMLDNEVFA